jgi:nickel transport protein
LACLDLHRPMRRPAFGGLAGGLLILLLFGAGFPLYAHRVNLFAWIEDGRVYTESYFPDGTKVKEGKISVLDQGGGEILSGVTDGEGNFSFPLPDAKTITIVLDASMGHRTTFTLEIDSTGNEAGENPAVSAGGVEGKGLETEDDGGKDVEEKGVEGKDEEGAVEEGFGANRQSSPGSGDRRVSDGGEVGAVSADELGQIVREEVSRQLEPVKASLRELEKDQGVSFEEVIAGLGYIFGLLGVYMFFKSRRG